LSHHVAAVSLEIWHWFYSHTRSLNVYLQQKFTSCGLDQVSLLRACICYSWWRILRKGY